MAIIQDLTILTDRLSKINEALARKTQARNEYDRTIQETEAAYMKVRLNGDHATAGRLSLWGGWCMGLC